MDADYSHNPCYISQLYDKITESGACVVIGSRYTKGAVTNVSFKLQFMSKLLNKCYSLVLGLKVSDMSNSFRIYDAAKLKAIKLTCDNFDILEEILIRLTKKFPDIQILEIPTIFNNRLHGKSKRKLFKFILSYIATLYKLKKLQGESI